MNTHPTICNIAEEKSFIPAMTYMDENMEAACVICALHAEHMSERISQGRVKPLDCWQMNR